MLCIQLFVRIERNNICTSTNGTSNWTKSTQSTDVLYRTIYGNELHIVVGSNNSSEDEGVIIKSSDGSTWSTVSTGTIGSLRGLTYQNNMFLTVGTGGTIMTSSDGSTWSSKTSGTTNTLYGVTYSE